MANDLTSYSVGLQVEYSPGRMLAHSAGIQSEHSPPGEILAHTVGLQTEYSESRRAIEARSVGLQSEHQVSGELIARALGLQVEYSEENRRLAARAVGAQYEYVPFTVYSVSPLVISDRGGDEITINGTFEEGESFTVDFDGEPAYGGFGTDLPNDYVAVVTDTLNQIKVWAPPLPVGSGVQVTVTKVSDPTKTATVADTLIVDKSSFTSNAFALRGTAGGLPRKVGAVDIKDEPL